MCQSPGESEGWQAAKFELPWPWPGAGAGEQRRNQVVPCGLWPSSFRVSLRSAGMGWPAASLVFGSLETPAKLFS